MNVVSSLPQVDSSRSQTSNESPRVAWPSRLLLALALILAVFFGSRGLFSEDAVSPYDMPRYLMNGVFLLDTIASGVPTSRDQAITFAAEYYARYPALSLGHHPPLLPIMLVPAYATLGVSVFAARLLILAMFLASVGAMYGMGRQLYGPLVGAWAAVLFASHPTIVEYEQQVMSEVPMVMLMIVAGWQLATFTRTGRARHYAGFAAAATLSLYARQFALFAFPAYAVILLAHGDWRRLFKRDILLLTVLFGLLMAPIIPMTRVLSRFNVAVVTSGDGRHGNEVFEAVYLAAAYNLRAGLWLLMLPAIGYAAWRNRTLLWTPLAWAGGVVAAVVLLTGIIAPERYTIGAIPGYCLIAATLAAWQVAPIIRRAAIAALVCVLAAQIVVSAYIRPLGFSGYETAAEWVLSHTKAPTVMFNGPLDTGMFSFFLRKHDAQKRLVMLRADKLFATSLMGWHGLTPQIDSPEAIYPILHRYGTQFLVVEDKPTDSKALEWLRAELKTPRFAERLRLPLNSDDRKMRGVSLVIYEYLGATPADPNAVLELDLPLVGRKIVVPLKDLTDGTGTRGRVLDLPPDRQP